MQNKSYCATWCKICRIFQRMALNEHTNDIWVWSNKTNPLLPNQFLTTPVGIVERVSTRNECPSTADMCVEQTLMFEVQGMGTRDRALTKNMLF